MRDGITTAIATATHRIATAMDFARGATNAATADIADNSGSAATVFAMLHGAFCLGGNRGG